PPPAHDDLRRAPGRTGRPVVRCRAARGDVEPARERGTPRAAAPARAAPQPREIVSGAVEVACDAPATATVVGGALPAGAVGLIRKSKTNGTIPEAPSVFTVERQSFPATDFGGTMQTANLPHNPGGFWSEIRILSACPRTPASAPTFRIFTCGAGFT